jgi:hypothetical protein
MKILINIFLILLVGVSFLIADDQGLQFLKQLTLKQLAFINSGDNAKTFKTIEIKVPEKEKRQVKSTLQIIKKDPVFVSQRYDFSNQTAYGKFEVLVITTSNNSFNISFSSDYPIQQYQLKDTVTKNTSKEESLNDKLSYTITVSKPFEPKYVLILSMFKDDFLSPNIVPLYKKESIKYK